MDADSFIINIKIVDDVKRRFDTANYEVNRQLHTGKNKK